MYKFDFKEIINFEKYYTEEFKNLILLLDYENIPYVFVKDENMENILRFKNFKKVFKFRECEDFEHSQFVKEIKNIIFK